MGSKQKDRTRKLGFYWAPLILLSVIAIASMVACWFFYHGSIESYKELRASVEAPAQRKDERAPLQTESHNAVSSDAPQTEMQSSSLDAENQSTLTTFDSLTADQYLTFLQAQTTEHQTFIERERQFLIWMLTVIIAGAGVLLSFFGLKRKKNIEELCEAVYKSNIDRIVSETAASSFETELSKKLGGEKRVQYLQYAVEKEKSAKNKMVCFIQRDNSLAFEKAIEKTREFFADNHKDHISVINYTDELLDGLPDDSSSAELKMADIVIYEVPAEEGGNKKTGMRYQGLDKYCEIKEKSCLLFCPNNIRINLDELSLASASVNYLNTLFFNIKERLYD